MAPIKVHWGAPPDNKDVVTTSVRSFSVEGYEIVIETANLKSGKWEVIVYSDDFDPPMIVWAQDKNSARAFAAIKSVIKKEVGLVL